MRLSTLLHLVDAEVKESINGTIFNDPMTHRQLSTSHIEVETYTLPFSPVLHNTQSPLNAPQLTTRHITLNTLSALNL